MSGTDWVGRDHRRGPARWHDVLKTLDDGSVLVHFSADVWRMVGDFLQQPASGRYSGGYQPRRGAAAGDDSRPTPGDPEWHAAQVLNFFSLHSGLSTLPPHVVNPVLDFVSEGRARAGTVIGAIKEFDKQFLLSIPQIGEKSAEAILTAYRTRGAVRFIGDARWHRPGNGRAEPKGEEERE